MKKLLILICACGLISISCSTDDGRIEEVENNSTRSVCDSNNNIGIIIYNDGAWGDSIEV